MPSTTHSKTSQKKTTAPPLNVLYLLLLIAYGFVTVLTPNLMTLDSGGPKFVSLALLNLITFIFLFTRKEIKTQPFRYYAFFRNNTGRLYAGMMLITLLSFLKAINVTESLLHFTKIFTAFSAAYLISILVMSDKRNVLYVCAAMTLLLIIDSITVFSGISKYIQGKITILNDIKSVYSNKNILASAVFVKLPFALWLMIFNRKWLRIYGILGSFMAMTALFFLSNRTFYLGLFTISCMLILFFLIRYKQSREKDQLKLGGILLTLIVSAFVIYSATQHYLYPKTYDAGNRSVEARLATITIADNSKILRLDGWKRSWHVFKKDPILGVGAGNWKIATLKEENLTTEGFKYQVKAHNDFVEIFTETGIFGGVFFISIFVLVVTTFIQLLFKHPSSAYLPFLFLPATGLICYSFDAFFNFPQDRPEIQALFALYTGITIAASSLYKSENKKLAPNPSQDSISHSQRIRKLLPISSKIFQPSKNGNRVFRLPLTMVGLLLLSVSVYILYLNFASLKLQLIIADDIKRDHLSHPASLFLEGFPSIPNLTIAAVPIAVQKARYLMVEHRNDEAIALLKADHSNPNDALSKGLMSEAYFNLKNTDSSLVYAQKMYELKPNNFQNISFLSERLREKGLQKEGEVLMDLYLSKHKKNAEAWIFTSTNYYKYGNLAKAALVIDEGAKYFPADSLIMKQKAAIDLKAITQPYQKLYDAATVAFNASRFREAAQYYSELLTKLPAFTEALENRAFCYYFTKQYANSIRDLNLLFSKGVIRSNLYNLMGVNYNYLKNTEEACKNFKIATDMGDSDGSGNYAKFCQSGKK